MSNAQGKPGNIVEKTVRFLLLFRRKNLLRNENLTSK